MATQEAARAAEVWLLRIGIIVLALVLAGLGGTRDKASPGVAEMRDLADDVIDELVEARAVGAPADLDDPLLAGSRTIVLAGGIDAGASRRVIAQLLHLDALDPGRPIDLYLRTKGGWENDAHAICDVMQRIRAPVNTWAVGACLSAGTIVLAGGTGRRRAFPGTVISIHVIEDPGDGKYSSPATYRGRAEEFWRRRAKLPESFFPMIGDRTYSLRAEEALELGVIDEIFRRTG
jgi:ATP-dependent Clp protease protease subunit